MLFMPGDLLTLSWFVRMKEPLLKLGLVLTPFVFWPGMDSRMPKEIFAFFIVLSVVLVGLHCGAFKRFDNPWILAFVGFCWISLCLAPYFAEFMMAQIHGDMAKGTIQSISLMPDRPISGMWMFKPVFFIFVYFLLLIFIASLELNKITIEGFLKIMLGCGAAMAIYIFIQRLGLDQFFNLTSVERNPDITFLDASRLGGFMGQPTVVAPFIAMLIPLAFYFKKFFVAFLMVAAVILTLSKVASLAMILGLLFFFVFS